MYEKHLCEFLSHSLSLLLAVEIQRERLIRKVRRPNVRVLYKEYRTRILRRFAQDTVAKSPVWTGTNVRRSLSREHVSSTHPHCSREWHGWNPHTGCAEIPRVSSWIGSRRRPFWETRVIGVQRGTSLAGNIQRKRSTHFFLRDGNLRNSAGHVCRYMPSWTSASVSTPFREKQRLSNEHFVRGYNYFHLLPLKYLLAQRSRPEFSFERYFRHVIRVFDEVCSSSVRRADLFWRSRVAVEFTKRISLIRIGLVWLKNRGTSERLDEKFLVPVQFTICRVEN